MATEYSSHRRSILTPVAYSEALMPSLQLARSSGIARRIAIFLCLLLFLTVVLMAFAPWQQSVTGAGYVVAYAPRERQQVLEVPIKGRIVWWNPEIVENSRVSKGEKIAEIQDLDVLFADRLESQKQNLQSVFEYAEQVVKQNEDLVKAYESIRKDTELAQNAYVQAAEEKVRSAKEKLSIVKAAEFQLQQAYDRLMLLEKEGNVALEKVQEAERKLLEAQGKIREEQANLSGAEADLRGKESDRKAYISKADAEVSYYRGTLDKSKGEVSKAKKDLLEIESKVAAQGTRFVEAPFDGYVVQLSANAGSGMVKEGDPLCTLVPYTTERAVQIWLDGNDAPLVEAGRHVRLQFEGWPAIQFAGWPSVAVGTFGGTIVSVDMVDNGKGKFRCQILPDPSETQKWPEERYLRQGVRANGWVLLEEVPLWFEVWRKLNGFPPALDSESSYSSGKSSSDKGEGDEKSKSKVR